MLVIDEYLAVRVLVGELPDNVDPDETFGLCAYRHYRLLQRVHAPGTGQLSQLLSETDLAAIRRPHPEVLQILDPRPLLDDAAAIGAAYNAAGLLVGETLAAGLAHGRQLWFGTARNVGKRLGEIADDIGIAIHISEPA
ncbi:hypothetical protein JYT71_00585 [Acidimicrobiaceae bacterium AH-315-P05]|nr:hypothetical protein [Acidimicrobiaceae bacterium AH-315-P05]